MIKNYMKAVIATMIVSTFMCGCGAESVPADVPEPVSELASQTEAAISDDTAVSAQTDDTKLETDKEAGTYKEAYLELINAWEEAHASDYIHGYKIFDLNDDDIPEIALIGGEEWSACEIHTFADGKDELVYSVKDLGVDGNGLYYYEKSGFTVNVKWNGGIGEYVFYDIMSDEPDKAYCTLTVNTGTGVSTEESTDIEFIEPSGDTVSNHYDEVYDIDNHPDKENVEASLGIKNLSDYHRIDNEDELMTFEEAQNALK